MTRPRRQVEKEKIVTSWEAFFAGPKTVLPTGIDFDEFLEAPFEE